MRLSTRLLLFGAVVPSCLLLWGFGAAGLLFDKMLIEALDRTMMAQAAVESASLFDRPGGLPHLHMERSPLGADATDPSAASAVYGPDGHLVVLFPSHAKVPQTLPRERLGLAPQLRTLAGTSGTGERELLITVRSPTGALHALRLTTSLQGISSTMLLYYQTAAMAAALVTLLLLGLQVWHARGLARRLHALANHMDRLRRGDLDAAPPPDARGDVISELRDAVADATVRLKSTRDASQRFLADAAHELRTPLAAMNIDIDVTLRRERDASELRETLERVRGEVNRLTRLARDLLDGAATRNTNWDCPLGDAADAVAQVLQAHKAVAEQAGVGLALVGPETMAVRFQPEALRQVVENLVTNAIRYAPRSTEVVVYIEELPTAWRMAVEDAGPGVAPADREDVFEPFHRKDRSGGGTGLGLAIVRDVARRHGGRAYIETSRAGGARVVVEFPLQPAI